jgi:hypothetical protein
MIRATIGIYQRKTGNSKWRLYPIIPQVYKLAYYYVSTIIPSTIIVAVYITNTVLISKYIV